MVASKPWERSKAVRRPPVAAAVAPLHPEVSHSAAPHPAASNLIAPHPATPPPAASHPATPLQLAAARSDSGSMVSRWASLGAPAQDVIGCLLSRWGVQPLEEERLLEETAESSCWSGMELRLGLAELQASGALQVRQRFWGERAVAAAPDRYIQWMEAAWPWTAGEERYLQGEVNVLEGGALLSRKLLGALAELARSGLTTTVKGQLYRKTVLAAGKAAGLKASLGDCLQLHPQLRLDYHPDAAFVLDWGLSSGILLAGRSGWRWNAIRLGEWLDEPLLLRERRLLRWVLDRAVRHSAASAAAASVLAELQEDVWYSAPELLKLLARRLGKDGGPDSGLAAWRSLLQMLSDSGWAEIGLAAHGVEGVRLLLSADDAADDEMEPEALLLQPDGDIWAGAWTPYRLLWPLELAAERGAARELTAYRFTERSLRSSEPLKIGAQWLAGWLSRSTGIKLPDPVKSMLERCLPAGEECGSPLLEPALADAAEKQDSDLFPSSWLPKDPASRFEELEPAPPLSPLAGLQSEAAKLPVTWRSSPRKYRSSSGRQLFESAVRLQLPVELRQGEESRIFIPLSVLGEGGEWHVHGFFRGYGRESEVLHGDGLDRLRLILPAGAEDE